MSTSSSAEVLASPSQSQETAKVLTAQAVLCGNTSDVFEKLSQLGLFGKTSQARYRHRGGKISDACSSPWLNSGIVCLGEYLTLNISEYPKRAEECMLSDILETTVPSRYFLTAKACQGILRRCEKVGRPLPSRMKEALEKQAHTPCISTTEEATTAAGEGR
jgi:cytosine-specific methyltransferase